MVAQILSSRFGRSSKDLATLVHKRTAGNPFYITHVLQSLVFCLGATFAPKFMRIIIDGFCKSTNHERIYQQAFEMVPEPFQSETLDEWVVVGFIKGTGQIPGEFLHLSTTKSKKPRNTVLYMASTQALNKV